MSFLVEWSFLDERMKKVLAKEGIYPKAEWLVTVKTKKAFILDESKLWYEWEVPEVRYKNTWLGNLDAFSIPLGPPGSEKPFLKNQAERRILFRFLDKFAQMRWEEENLRFWKIRCGILIRGYEIFKKDPQKLEQIMKVAKTKRELKILLGMS